MEKLKSLKLGKIRKHFFFRIDLWMYGISTFESVTIGRKAIDDQIVTDCDQIGVLKEALFQRPISTENCFVHILYQICLQEKEKTTVVSIFFVFWI